MASFVFTGEDLVHVGNNPEMADCENPRGMIFGHRWIVRSLNESYEYTHARQFETEVEAEKLRGRVEQHLEAGGDLNRDHWHRRTLYGGPAWSHDDEVGLMDDDEIEGRRRAGLVT